jgi:PKD domain.
MKYQLSVLTIISIVLISVSTGALITKNISQVGNELGWFDIKVDLENGTNSYTLIEVDEGDNNEEQLITEVFHIFKFTTINPAGVITWDFGDGTSAMGESINHSYSEPGTYRVRATSIDSDKIQSSATWVFVDFVAFVESDNMECECAPTAKDTVIDITPLTNGDDISGYVRVEHDGSSESCSLRNPLQECHLRIIIQTTNNGEVVSNNVIYDENFRSNEVIVDFELTDLMLEEGQGLQIRLETDQLRDWHKPYTEWAMGAPSISS